MALIHTLKETNMGWWKSGTRAFGEEEVIGDVVGDIMEGAVEDIIDAYEQEWGRLPTENEILSLVKFVLEPLGLPSDR